ncbi:MAG: DUF559 domain-containing protein [Bacteroidota bacterium]
MSAPVLVALAKSPADLEIARTSQWYRVPKRSFKWVRRSWPPQWLAFYLPRAFGAEAYTIAYYAPVIGVREVPRCILFPNEPKDARSAQPYLQLLLGPLQTLPRPIVSLRRRRILFIHTSWDRLTTARELNDLYSESPLEDRLWGEFRDLKIAAERQEAVRVGRSTYFLDFAIYCQGGKIDVEADGDSFHANPTKAAADNLRDNALVARGWRVLRFSTRQINSTARDYCLRTVGDTINQLGGLAPLPEASYQVGHQFGLFAVPNRT